MSKAEILERFNDINFAYNNCTMHDSLSYVLDEFEQEIRNKAIDEFAEQLKNKLVLRYGSATPTEQYVAMQVTEWCNEIAEQMKGE